MDEVGGAAASLEAAAWLEDEDVALSVDCTTDERDGAPMPKSSPTTMRGLPENIALRAVSVM